MPAAPAAPSKVEYESLKDGAGLIPPEFRNRGYEKLDFGPGEGGLGNLNTGKGSAATDATMDAFLAGVAAGADPKDMAKELRSGSSTTRRGRGATKKAPVPAAVTEEV
jgi:hypothetical protein